MHRKRTTPIANEALATRVGETGLTYAAIAEIINSVTAENGYSSRYDASSIGHWLTGRVPAKTAMPAIVEAFARLLGRPELQAGDLGWETTDAAQTDSPWTGDPVTWIVRLGRCDMNDIDRRTVLSAGTYSLAACAVPPLKDLAMAEPGSPRADAARIGEMTDRFGEMDDRFGGGHARVAVAAYLTGQVTPLLRQAGQRAGRDLCRAAADLVYLAGFMAADAGQAGLAQRYYVQAVRLAARAGDPLLRAKVLRALALQAVDLLHPRQAIALADAALRSLPPGSPPRARAWMTAMRAEADAHAGDARRARHWLHVADRDLERADSPATPATAAGFDRAAFHHQAGTTLAQMGDLSSAQVHLAESVAARRVSQRRSRALIGSRLALVQARLDRPDAAADTVNRIADDLELVTSARVDRELATLRAVWRPATADADVLSADRSIADSLRGRR